MAARFNLDWMNKEEYKDWLLPEQSDNTKARCKFCRRTFSLSNMGEPSLKSHAQGKKHQSIIQRSEKNPSVKGFLEKKDVAEASTSEESGPSTLMSSSAEQKSSFVTKFALTKEHHKAEIIWALKSVMSHFSYNSAHDITDIFKAMFPDSSIAQHMSCGPTELSYLISFGIAPYFRDLLLADLKQTSCFVVSFDESFNHELQKEQMDFTVRYFKNNKVESRYLTSLFLGHTTAKDLKKKFEEATEQLDMKKLLQISMDGPNVNWKLLDTIAEDRSSNEQYPILLNVGSCSVHVVHGAFRNGIKQTNWEIDLLLRSLHSLFNETPARREDYTKITGSRVFPQQFCGHRWLEDKKVAERALEIWPNITVFITETLKKPKNQIPTSASFATVRSAVQSHLTIAKLQFFISTAVIMKPYLQVFQSGAPLLPFVTSELHALLQTLMGKFVKREELEAADSSYKIAKLNVSHAASHVTPSEIDIGFAAKATVDKALRKKRISQLQVLEFRKECEVMLQTTVSKMQEKSPLKYNLARKLVSMDPRLMVSNPDNATKMFQQVLQILIENRWKTPEVADTVLAQYRKFVFNAKKYHPEKFSSFKSGEDRLDSFLSETLQAQEEYQELWLTMQLLLTLSHGQATVERGFSVNKEVLTPNLQELSLQAIRLVHSSVLAQNIKVADFIITEALLSSCNHASNRHNMHLMEKKEEKEKTEKGRKRKALEENLIAAKKEKLELERVSKKLLDTADKKEKDAEKKKDATVMKALLMESNASRERAEQIQKKDIPAQDKEIKKIEEKIKKID